jgi:alcohol dehydrogenase class IV
MNTAIFSFPTRIVCGPGTVARLPEELVRLKVNRPLVVTDAGLLQTQTFNTLAGVLGTNAQGKTWFVHSGIHPNPIEADVRQAAAACLGNQCDGVIALGGGSPLDAAKAARLLVKRPGFSLARFYEEPDWAGLLPFVAIPTTAGTGSEVGRSSVITLDGAHRKTILGHPELLARAVILDAQLTTGLPPKLTAATGADALTHCIESFTCPVYHPMCDGIALEGIRLIVNALPKAFTDGMNLDARGEMLMAASMGAVAFQKDLGVVHSLAHPLSTLCGMHHGLANALCLVAGMAFCAGKRTGIYRRVGIACGVDVLRDSNAEADMRTIQFIGSFLVGLGLNTRLSDHGVKREQLDALVEQAFEDPCHRTNVVPVTKDDLRRLYLEVL